MNNLISRLTDATDLRRQLQDLKEEGDRVKIDEMEMQEVLKSRVKGQDHVVDDFAKLIRLQWGKTLRKRPIANILFLGPTGTGKTELAKAAAEYLYGSEKAMLRFDCGELKNPESITRLIGTPTGYQGSDKGGQLTRPVLDNRKRLVVFDEIDKGNPLVYDLFLQMMGDGRLTEQGSGKVADFTESIIILTSNSEFEAVCKMQEEIKDAHELVNAVKSHLAEGKLFRPEILGRIDRIYIFKPLPIEVMAEIALLKMEGLAKAYGLELSYVDSRLVVDVLKKSVKVSKFGARELERIVDDSLGEGMIAAKETGAKRVRVDLDSGGKLVIRPSEAAA